MSIVDPALAARVERAGRDVGLFASAREVVVAGAPGRLDVFGGIADYSGATVLEWPLGVATAVGIARRVDDRVVVHSSGATFATGIDVLRAACEEGPAAVRRLVVRESADWAAYVLGVLAIWWRQPGIALDGGFDIVVVSDVPAGAGVASSAALTVACARAFADVLGVDRDPIPFALDCQRVENEVVGAPCGAMDPVVVHCGEPGRLLRIRCQPAEITGRVAPPRGWTFAGVDSGTRHSVAGAGYARVRAAAFMGWQMLAEIDGAPVVADAAGVPHIEHPAWGRWLANVEPDAWRSRAARLPVECTGAEFVARHGRLIDPVSSLDDEASHPVRAATAHPILENARIREFEALLPHLDEPSIATRAGQLMFASHASYTICGLGSRETDEIVDAVREAGIAEGFAGAKITGGGSGGTVAVLLREDALEALRALVAPRPVLTA